MSGCRSGVVKIMHGHVLQERRHSLFTNQCLGKETNTEPPGRGTDESFLMDSDIFIVIGNLQRFSPAGTRGTSDEAIAADGDTNRVLPVTEARSRLRTFPVIGDEDNKRTAPYRNTDVFKVQP